MLDQFFCINIVHCVYMNAEIPILAPKKTLKETFLFGNFWDWNVHCSVNCLIFRPMHSEIHNFNCVSDALITVLDINLDQLSLGTQVPAKTCEDQGDRV